MVLFSLLGFRISCPQGAHYASHVHLEGEMGCDPALKELCTLK